MTISIFQLVLTIIIILGIGLGFFYNSGGYDDEVVQGIHAPVGHIDVAQDKPLIVPFKYPGNSTVGVLFYAATISSATADLNIVVIDSKGRVVAQKISQHTAYHRSGNPAISIFLSFQKSLHDEQQLRLIISPRNNGIVSLAGNIQESDSTEPILIFSTLHNTPPSFATRQGVYVGLALSLFFIALYAIKNSNKVFQWIFAAVGICVFSFSAGLPYVYHAPFLGINDWDGRYSLAHIYIKTIQTYHQIPMWNPFFCGGTAVLGDPELSIFTPTFMLQALFGVDKGAGYAIILGFIVTGLGILLLARRLGLPLLSGVVSAVIVLFSSALFLKATEGHVTIIFAYMWVPWILWAWISKRVFLCALFLSFALLQGGIYIVSYTALSIIGIISMSRHRIKALVMSSKVALWMIGLSSFQLIPTIFWLKEYPDKSFIGSTYTYNSFSEILFGRYLDHTFILQNQISDWHEYGAYIGYGVALLILLGLSFVYSKRVVRVLAIGMITALLLSSFGPIFEHFLWYMPYIPRSNISRLILFALLCGALVAGFGMKRLLIVFPKMPIIPLIIAGFISIDLMSLEYPIADQAFVVPQVSSVISPAKYPLEYTRDSHPVRTGGMDFVRSYESTLRGYGTFAFCSAIGPDSAVIEQTSQNMHPPYIISSPHTTTSLQYWSPDAFAIKMLPDKVATDVVINMNYAAGWHSTGGKILRDHKLLTVKVPSGTRLVALRYIPPGSILGLCITIATILYACMLKDAQSRKNTISRFRDSTE